MSSTEKNDLLPCPYCGCEDIDVKYIGNDHTKTRKVQLKCNSCRITRTDGAIYNDHEWCYETAKKQWNTRADSWISVDERLPNPDFDWVLVYSDSAMATMMYTKNNGFHGYTPNHIAVSMITHWKPLPPAPTK